MSTLQVANIHFTSGGTTRIDQVGSTVNIVSPSTNVSGNLVTTGAVSAANVSISGTNLSPVMSAYKNKIINGNFDIWQRGTSNGMSGYYTADRWYCLNTGTTKTASQQAFTLGQTDVPGEPTYFMRHVVTSVAGAGNRCNLLQYIESVRTLAGKTATLSFWAKADTSKNIAVEFIQRFGTGGSPSSDVSAIDVKTFALTSSWQKFTTTVSVPSISGKTLGSNNDDSFIVNFWFDAGSTYNSRSNSLGQQSGTFDIAQIQLEEGPVATAFESRHIGQELALCQRYYFTCKIDDGGGAGIKYSSSGGNMQNSAHIFPSTMRTIPTATVVGTPTYSNCSAITTYATSIYGALSRVTVTALGQYRAYDATLTCDAEL